MWKIRNKTKEKMQRISKECNVLYEIIDSQRKINKELRFENNELKHKNKLLIDLLIKYIDKNKFLYKDIVSDNIYEVIETKELLNILNNKR